MESSNPALAKLAPRGATNAYGDSGWYQPGSGPYAGPMTAARTGTMTVDDVIVRTVGLLVLLTLSAAAAWQLVPDSLIGVVVLVGSLGALILGLVISFGRLTSPLAIGAYAVLEGAVTSRPGCAAPDRSGSSSASA